MYKSAVESRKFEVFWARDFISNYHAVVRIKVGRVTPKNNYHQCFLFFYQT